jgi:hypothetical protein
MSEKILLIVHKNKETMNAFGLVWDVKFGGNALFASNFKTAIKLSKEHDVDILVIGDFMEDRNDGKGMRKTFEAIEKIKSRRKILITTKRLMMESARSRGLKAYEEVVCATDILKEEVETL